VLLLAEIHVIDSTFIGWTAKKKEISSAGIWLLKILLNNMNTRMIFNK
jgi:hypothetical protein